MFQLHATPCYKSNIINYEVMNYRHRVMTEYKNNFQVLSEYPEIQKNSCLLV